MSLRILLAIIILISVWGCEDSVAVNPSPSATLPGEKVEFYKVGRQKVPSYLKVTGSVQPDLEGTVRIISPLAGSVEKIFVRVGDQVKKGDPLITVKSAEINAMHSLYIALQSQFKEANRVYSLNRQLFDVGAVTQNDLLKSEAAARELEVHLTGLRKKLEIYGVSLADGFSDQLEIKSPISGRIAEVPAGIGMRPNTNDVLMTIIDPVKMVVVANIHDSDITKVQKGALVSFTTDIFPNTLFNGVVSYISDVSNPDAKTIKVYIRLPNKSHPFKLNMFLDMEILRGEATLPVIPKTAVVYKQGKFCVYIKDGDTIKLREVSPKSDVDDRFMSVEGISEGDEIVLSAIGKEKV